MRRREITIAGCAAVAGIGGTVFGLGISHLAQFDDKALAGNVVAQVERAYRQELCLFHAIRKDVPKGASVYLPGNNPAHTQRLAELSTLWAIPTESQRTAEWVLTITKLNAAHREHPVRGTRQSRCYGDLLVARQT